MWWKACCATYAGRMFGGGDLALALALVRLELAGEQLDQVDLLAVDADDGDARGHRDLDEMLFSVLTSRSGTKKRLSSS